MGRWLDTEIVVPRWLMVQFGLFLAWRATLDFNWWVAAALLVAVVAVNLYGFWPKRKTVFDD